MSIVVSRMMFWHSNRYFFNSLQILARQQDGVLAQPHPQEILLFEAFSRFFLLRYF